jgi:predicted AlkP superfamily pyrophosphatase or phosphodiesterase
VPAFDRSLGVATGAAPAAEVAKAVVVRDRAVEVLCDPALAHVVDLIAYPDGEHLVVANARGAVRLSRSDPDAAPVSVRGANPIARTDPLAFTPAEAELADPSPPNERNAYPYAGRRLSNLFLAVDRAPDIAVVHTPRHHWPERGGHLGEHGSLDAVQSRAPLILSGAGIASRGTLARAARVVDVAPTLARLAGVPPGELAGLDGEPLTEVAEPGSARHVVGLLWDGASCNDLLHLAGTGALPSVARLLERGCALAGGAIAEFPSVTLVNHTCALTGVGPGRHGIVNNAYFDRTTGRRVLANASSTWHRAMEELRPGVPTVFHLAGDERTACVNEPADSGAAYSTFGLVRDAGHSEGAKSMGEMLPDPYADPLATADFVGASSEYRYSTAADGVGLQQMLGLFTDAAEAPRLTWWNSMLTDTGHHEGGPRSVIARAAMADTDRRLGVFLDRLEQLGLYDDTTFLLTADHGSEAADPDCRGDWDEALREAGIPFRDEAYGFLYLG